MTEKFSNDAATTLSAALAADATTCSVTSATAFPASGNFRIRIDEELLLVTGVSGATFTITRGIEGTAATGHQSGVDVVHLLTKGSIEARIEDRLISDTYANRPTAGIKGRLFLPTDGLFLEYDDGSAWHKYGPFRRLKPPPETGWSWVNQGNATVTYTGGILVLEDPDLDASNPQLRLYVRPATSWPIDVTMAFTWNGIRGASDPVMGFCTRQVGGTDDGQFTIYGVRINARTSSPYNRRWQIRNTSYTSPTASEATGTWSGHQIQHSRLIWWRFKTEGNKKRIYYSADGVNFTLCDEDDLSDYNTPYQLGIFIDPQNNTQKISLSLVHWEEN